MSPLDADSPNTPSPASLLAQYAIDSQDLERVRHFGETILPKLDEYIARFYDWLERQPDFDRFFASAELVDRVKGEQVSYWAEFFGGKVDDAYLAKRVGVGQIHARIGLPLPTYFAAMNFMLVMWCEALAEFSTPEAEKTATAQALAKQIHLDTAVVVDTFSRMTSDTIAEQNRSLMAMSTPVTAVWKDILMLPIVGIVDSRRAQEIMSAMLTAIEETQSKVIILDIGGVAIVDTAVANHLIKITKATRLMGCNCTISGVSPSIAQTVVELGIDVGDVDTTATLKDALVRAFKATGVVTSSKV
jgi:rsbT co-antagonist protein RsbR